MDPLTIGTMGMGLFKAGMNLFDNSAANAAHEQNKARVGQINRANQATHFNNLSIRARALNKQSTAKEQIYNIDNAAMQRKASRNLAFNRATQDSLQANQSDVIKLFRSMSGPRSGQMNLDSSLLAEMGRAGSDRRNKLMRSQDDLLTSGYMDNFQAQNQRSQVKNSISTQPIYQQYTQNYSPVKSGSNMTNKLLGLAGDLGTTAMDSLKMHNSLKPPEIGDTPLDPTFAYWGQ
jgi:hypothetical protein